MWCETSVKRLLSPGWMASLMVVALLGCATGSSSLLSDARWREDLGRSTRSTLATAVEKVFRKHAVELRRSPSVGERELRYETVWVDRQVTAAEEGAGVTRARNRIVLVGTPMDAQFSGGRVYRVRWQVENEITSVKDSNWHMGPMVAEVQTRLQPVFSDLEMELRTGLR